MKQPDDYFYDYNKVVLDQPYEPAYLFEQRAKGFEIWCHVCDGLTTYHETFYLPTWKGYKPCPYCGLYGTIQDIT